MKKILLIAPKYSTVEDNPYLTNDLVHELSNQGCSVTVVSFGEKSVTRCRPGVCENIIEIKSNLKVFKYFFIWPRLFYVLAMLFIKRSAFDQIVMCAPLCVMWPAVLFVWLFKATKKTAIVFDIFPIHQVKISALPRLLEPPLRFLEKLCLACFTEITAMGERNKQYIEEYYSATQINCKVVIMNLWGRGIFSDHRSSDTDCIRVVFGGQIIKGREIGQLIKLFEKLRMKGLPLIFDIYSKGKDFDEMKSFYSGLDWLTFKQQLPRDEYFSRLSEYQVGAIVTDKKADLPTFPSKIIDYAEAGLKVYCLVEKESELNALLDNNSAVYINHFSFTEEEILKSFSFFKLPADSTTRVQIQRVRDLFSVSHAASRLIE